jgi:hypothetical protein
MRKGFIYSKQDSLFGQNDVIGFGEDDFFVKEITKELAKETIIKNHYSKKVYSATYIHLGIFIQNSFIGVLQFGYAMNPASCSSVVDGTKTDEYLELNRMWLSDSAPRNSESKALSYCIKYIKQKYRKIKWIQSFADERCGGFGIVYQAANFDYYGEHSSIFWECDNEIFHNSIKTSEKAGKRGHQILNAPENQNKIKSYKLRQFRYIYFIDKSWAVKCCLSKKPYIKHYNA